MSRRAPKRDTRQRDRTREREEERATRQNRKPKTEKRQLTTRPHRHSIAAHNHKTQSSFFCSIVGHQNKRSILWLLLSSRLFFSFNQLELAPIRMRNLFLEVLAFGGLFLGVMLTLTEAMLLLL